MKETKIEYYDLGEEVADMLFREKRTLQDISDRIKRKHGIDISTTSIANFKKFVIKSAGDMANRDPEYYKHLEAKFLNTTEHLVFMIEEVKERMERYKDLMITDKDGNETPDWRAHAMYFAEFQKAVELLLKRSKEIGPSVLINKNTQINMMQVNQLVQDQIVDLIDRGEILLDTCGPLVKDYYRKVKAKA